MYLKRFYKDADEGGNRLLDYISLAHTGSSPEQNFNIGLVTELITLGFMEINGDTLIFRVHPEDLRYQIKRAPGRYCLHCGQKLDEDQGGEMARLHVALNHKGLKSPNPNTPAGYEWLRYYECVLNGEQHEKYKFVAGDPIQFPRKDE